MGRFVAGSLSALLLAAAGLFWWQGRASLEPQSVTARADPPAAVAEALPIGDPDAVGNAPPALPSATQRTREQRRFDRYDKDRDAIITRAEMLGSRVKAFRKLDTDGNNLLSFEEWAARTTQRFEGADANRDGRLTRPEFATTAPKPSAKPDCSC